MIDPFTSPFSRKTSFNLGFSRDAGNATSTRQLGALCDQQQQPQEVSQQGEDYTPYLSELLEMRSSGMQGLYANNLEHEDEFVVHQQQQQHQQQQHQKKVLLFDAINRPVPVNIISSPSNSSTSLPSQTTSTMGYFDFVGQPFTNPWQQQQQQQQQPASASSSTMAALTTTTFAAMPATCAPEDTMVVDWARVSAPSQDFTTQTSFFHPQSNYHHPTIAAYDGIQPLPFAFDPTAYEPTTLEPSSTIPAVETPQRQHQRQEPRLAQETRFERIKRKLSFGKSRGRTQHVCTDCTPPRAYDRRCDLHKHSRYHRRENICPEPGCENHKGFGTPRDLERHKQTKHGLGKEEYYCSEQGCKYASKPMSRKDNMQKHMRQKHSRGNNSPPAQQ